MKWLVTVRFVHGRQEERAALLPAEQVHVRALLAEGVIEALHIGADRSRIWLVMQGESEDRVLQTLAALPLYPYMALELAPLRETVLGKTAEGAAADARPGAVAKGA